MLPLFHYPGFKPFSDMAYYPPIRNPVLDKLHYPFMVDGVEKSTNVRIEHPVHLLPPDPDS
jgi:hypothetical protein